MGKSYSSREILEQLRDDGWQIAAQVGSHVQLKHKTKPGRVTVQHPRKDVPIGTRKTIERQAGIKFR